MLLQCCKIKLKKKQKKINHFRLAITNRQTFYDTVSQQTSYRVNANKRAVEGGLLKEEEWLLFQVTSIM